MKLSKNSFGLALGIVLGLCMFLWALAAEYLNWGSATITLMQDIYLGFKAGVIGGLMGLLWGFVNGYVVGFVIAWIYNMFGCKNNSQAPGPNIPFQQ